jgi:hypothetical protein
MTALTAVLDVARGLIVAAVSIVASLVITLAASSLAHAHVGHRHQGSAVNAAVALDVSRAAAAGFAAKKPTPAGVADTAARDLELGSERRTSLTRGDTARQETSQEANQVVSQDIRLASLIAAGSCCSSCCSCTSMSCCSAVLASPFASQIARSAPGRLRAAPASRMTSADVVPLQRPPNNV